MIINHEKKIVILLTPKTGSTTIRMMFRDHVVNDYGSHATYDQAVEHLGMDGYQFYAFCRDPIDRALSAMTMAALAFIQLHSDRDKVQKFIDTIFPDKKIVAPPAALSERDHSGFKPFHGENIGSRTLPSIMLAFNHPPTFAGLIPQINWLANPAVNILRYEQFDANVHKLCDLMGVSIDRIPQMNKSESRLSKTGLSSEEVDFIRKYYDKDYRLLRSRGIIY